MAPGYLACGTLRPSMRIAVPRVVLVTKLAGRLESKDVTIAACHRLAGAFPMHEFEPSLGARFTPVDCEAVLDDAAFEEALGEFCEEVVVAATIKLREAGEVPYGMQVQRGCYSLMMPAMPQHAGEAP